MTPRIFVPSDRERRIAEALRRMAVQKIESIGDVGEVARLLETKPFGVRALVSRPEWDLDVAFRVADSLGLPIVKAMESVAAD